MIGTNFFSLANAFEVLRLSVEIGLLAVALTPVIITGGIDLSVGSLMGLSAVVFGKLWRDGGLADRRGRGGDRLSWAGWRVAERRFSSRAAESPPDRDAGLVLAVPRTGRRADWRRRQLHPFPRAVPVSGPGIFVRRSSPAQVPIFVVVAAASGCLLHRTTIGRGLVAIGFSPEGARYAGLPVERLVGLVYLLSGLVASLAAVIYVAHLGQAKADAGTGYELAAITAVVLGGTSIFGGRGSVPGTLLGLFAIAVLAERPAPGRPARRAGRGLDRPLLLLAIGLTVRPHRAAPRGMPTSSLEVMTVKNSQVAVICAAILAAALINAVSNSSCSGRSESENSAAMPALPATAPTAGDSTGGRRNRSPWP